MTSKNDKIIIEVFNIKDKIHLDVFFHKHMNLCLDKARKEGYEEAMNDGFVEERICNEVRKQTAEKINNWFYQEIELLIKVIKERMKMIGESDLDLGRIQGLLQAQDLLEKYLQSHVSETSDIKKKGEA